MRVSIRILLALIGSLLVVIIIIFAVRFSGYVGTAALNALNNQIQKTVSGTIQSGPAILAGHHTLTLQARTSSGEMVESSTSFTVTSTTDPYKALIIYPVPRTSAQDKEVSSACRDLGNPNNVFDIKQFGAKGDGTTDDYSAIRGAAAFISQPENAGKTLYYPPGTYKVARVIDDAHGEGGNLHILYLHAKDIKIIGCNAKIDVEGNFRLHPFKLADGSRPVPYWAPNLHQVIPFYFVGSSGFLLQGFELNGNVDKMTRDTQKDGQSIEIAGAVGFGVLTSSSSDYIMQNMNIHGFPGDGIFLGAGSGYKADRNATVRDVVSSGNGRQGLSVIQLRGGLFQRVKFLNTGRVGAFGGSAPQAGVDIEPIFRKSTKPELDMDTGDLVFENCEFANNNGSQLTSGITATENVTLNNATIISDANSSPSVVEAKMKNFLINHSDIHIEKGAMNLAYAPFSASDSLSATVLSSTIHTKDGAFRVTGKGAHISVEGNTIIGEQILPTTNAMIDFSNSNSVVFKNNTITISANAYSANNQVFADLSGAAQSIANSFDTTLSGSAGEVFRVKYGASTVVQKDNYIHPIVIKPFGVTTFSNPYSK